jgi:hypothetical protein
MKNLNFAALLLTYGLCLFTSDSTAQTQTYTVTNNTGQVITSVNLSPAKANDWGSSLNTTGSVANSSAFNFTHTVDKSNCLYDIRYTSESGETYYINGIDLCSYTSISLAKSDMNDMKNDAEKMEKQ